MAGAVRVVVGVNDLWFELVEVGMLQASITCPLDGRLKQDGCLLAGRSPRQSHHAVLPFSVLDQLEHLLSLFVPDLIDGDFVKHVGCAGHPQGLLLVLLPLCFDHVVRLGSLLCGHVLSLDIFQLLGRNLDLIDFLLCMA